MEHRENTVTNGAFRKLLHDEKVRSGGDFDAGHEMSRDKKCTYVCVSLISLFIKPPEFPCGLPDDVAESCSLPMSPLLSIIDQVSTLTVD